MCTTKKETHDLGTASHKTLKHNPISQKKSAGNGVFVIAECESIVCTVRQTVIFTKIEASDYTDTLLKFKKLKHINRLPYHTMIFPESVVNYYSKGV